MAFSKFSMLMIDEKLVWQLSYKNVCKLVQLKTSNSITTKNITELHEYYSLSWVYSKFKIHHSKLPFTIILLVCQHHLAVPA